MGGLFGGGDVPAPAPVAIPTPPKATPMQDPVAVGKKKKIQLARSQQRGGRDSTVLGSEETMG